MSDCDEGDREGDKAYDGANHARLYPEKRPVRPFVKVNEEAKDSNPKDAAASNRLDLSLVPSSAIAFIALALQEGDFKYGGYNWRVAGVRASVYVAACQRHLFKWLNGEWEDEITHVPHLANALACLAILVDAHMASKLEDDRPPKQNLTMLLDACESVVSHLRATFKKTTSPPRHTEKPQNASK